MKSLATSAHSRATQLQYWLAAAGILAICALVPQARHAESLLETTVRIEGSEAEAVTRELTERFRSPFAHRLVLVIRGLPEANSEEGAQALARIVEALRNSPGVSATMSYADARESLFLGRGGGTFVLVGLALGSSSAEAELHRLREVSKLLQSDLRERYPAIAMQWTGEIPLSVDLRKTSSDDARESELLALPLTLILLLVAFGSVVAALLPLVVGFLAIAMTLGGAALLAAHFHMSILIQNLATMIGLGLGIDFALLMVSRFREVQTQGANAREAADSAFRFGGHTLVLSASTVAIGFAALLLVPISELRSIGVAGLVVTGCSLLLSVGLIPVVLGALGRRIDAWPLMRGGPARLTGYEGAAEPWRRWGMWVVLHPWAALMLAGIPLVMLASQAPRLAPGIARGDWLPATAESVQGLHALREMDRAGVVQTIRVIVELPPGATLNTDAGWNAIDRLSRHLADDPRVEQVISLSTLMRNARGIAPMQFISDALRRSLVRGDNRATLVEIVTGESVTPAEQIRWVSELRRVDAATLTGMSGVTLRVGGIPALNADYASVVGAELPRVMLFVAAGTFLSLFLGFGSVVVAIKAIALNLLSVGAAFGALVLVFQDGYGAGIFGVPGGTGGVFPIVPILTFAVVFGLSMDYEVFFVSRVLEARRGGRSESDAIAEGLARTGRLITSAAAIMVVVFGAFMLGSFLIVKMVGFTLAVAVLIDAIVVRSVIGPALLALAGDWNWWPWGLSRGARPRRDAI